MPHARLLRFADTPFGVFGFLDLADDGGTLLARFCTAEDDWMNNLPGKSAIPAGRYLCRRRFSPKFQMEVFEVTNVPGRGDILIHPGNTENDVEGCILVGQLFGAIPVPDEDDPAHPTRPTWAVLESKLAFARWMGLLAGLKEVWLEVVWSPPGAWRRPV